MVPRKHTTVPVGPPQPSEPAAQMESLTCLSVDPIPGKQIHDFNFQNPTNK